MIVYMPFLDTPPWIIATLTQQVLLLNKWLKEQLTESYVIHGFRHSFRDRLRAVECPSEIIDQLGGWSLKSVGQGYGKGFGLSIIHSWLKKI